MSSRATTLAQNARTTTMRMKTTTAFRAYAKVRARQTIERNAATARFMVKSVNKDAASAARSPPGTPGCEKHS